MGAWPSSRRVTGSLPLRGTFMVPSDTVRTADVETVARAGPLPGWLSRSALPSVPSAVGEWHSQLAASSSAASATSGALPGGNQ